MFKFSRILISLLLIMLLISIVVYGTPTYVNLGPNSYIEGDVGIPGGSNYYKGGEILAEGYNNLTEFIDQTPWRLFYSDGSGDVIEVALGAGGTYLKSNGETSALTFDTPTGAGNVNGPATSIDHSVARFDGADNKTIQDSLATIDDSGSVNIPAGQSYKINTTALAKGDVGLGNIENLKVKLDATTAPAVTNDVDEEYVVGSRWCDVTNDKEYVCLDNTDGAAVWTETTGAGGEATTASNIGAQVEIFKQLTGVDLEFRTLYAGSNKMIVTNTASGGIKISNDAPTTFVYAFIYGADHYVGQSWLATSFTLGKIKVRLKREGTPGTLYCKLYAEDGNDAPTGGVLSTGSVNGNNITTGENGELVEFIMDSNYAVSNAIKYVFVLTAPTGNANNFIVALYLGNVYADGKLGCVAGGSYTLTTEDLPFEIWSADATNNFTTFDIDPSKITELSGLTTPLGAAYGGTGVANNAAETITIGGAGTFPLTLTLTASTNVTLPITGTLATTSNKLSAFAATTSAELAGVISNETGTGTLVFGTSPTLVTPTGCLDLLSTTTISFAADADTTLYTVPAGKRCVLHSAIVVAAADAGATTTVSIGADGTETDFIPANTLSNLDTQYDSVILQPIPNTTPLKTKSYAATTVIQAQVATQSGAANNKIYLFGILY